MPINAPISPGDVKPRRKTVQKHETERAGSSALAAGEGSDPVMAKGESLLWRYRYTPSAGYAAAVLLTAAACGLTFAAREALPALTLQSALFVCATVAASWFGGFGPGVLTSLLSTLCIGAFFLQPESYPLAATEVFRLFLNFLAGTGISWLGGLQRRHEEALFQSLSRMNERVRARTAPGLPF